MSLVYEGVIRSDRALDGFTFKLAEVVRHRKGISGYLDDRVGPQPCRYAATDTIEVGPDGVARIVFKEAVRERRSEGKAA